MKYALLYATVFLYKPMNSALQLEFTRLEQQSAFLSGRNINDECFYHMYPLPASISDAVYFYFGAETEHCWWP